MISLNQHIFIFPQFSSQDDVIQRITGIALNDVGDDSRANRRYSSYMRSLLDGPTTTTTTTTTKKPPALRQAAPKRVDTARNRFIVGRGAGMYNVNYIENS